MIPYIGGKSFLANWIISQFPEGYEKLTYCEVFGGGGWVLFKKDLSNVEVYNDLNRDLVNLFRIIRDNYPEFQHRAQWSLHSREMFQEAKERLKGDEFLNEVERAMAFAISQIQSFAGTGSTWGYAVTADKVARGMWMPFLKRLEYINARLKFAQIECLNFEKCIAKYDTPETLFYLDPPYVDAEKYYKVPFTLEDHKRLAEILKEVKGRFILSYYDHDLVRSLYKGFRVLEKETAKHSCGITKQSRSKTRPRGHELLIMNY
jgi:DNA adenine methylase